MTKVFGLNQTVAYLRLYRESLRLQISKFCPLMLKNKVHPVCCIILLFIKSQTINNFKNKIMIKIDDNGIFALVNVIAIGGLE